MKIYNLREMNALATQHNFNRDTLEKVVRLIDILSLFNTHKELKQKYVLKGGTAINLCLFDLPRLSVDIDMNFSVECTTTKMLEVRELHRKIIKEQVAMMGYNVDSKSRFTYTLDSYLLKYTNSKGNPDNIKVELNYSNRTTILDTVNYEIKSEVINTSNVLALNKIELYGSKIAALIGRTTARDAYDVYNLIDSKIINDKEIRMLKKCSIFYLVTSNNFQSLEYLLSRFHNNMKNMSFRVIQRNLIPMLHVGEQIELDTFKQTVVDYIDELFNVNESEQKFINAFNKKEYSPDLLFDKEIAVKLKNHPMALWKMRNF